MTDENISENSNSGMDNDAPLEQNNPVSAPEIATADDGKSAAGEEGVAKEKTEEFDYSKIDMPEGFEVNQEIMAEVSPLLKEMRADAEKAQALAAVGAKLIEDTYNKQLQAWQKQVDDWEKEVLADSEIGTKEAIAIANRAVQKFGSPKLQEELLRLGIGNHPELVRCFWKIGTMISDDSLVVSSKSNAEPKTLGEALYGDKYDKKQE